MGWSGRKPDPGEFECPHCEEYDLDCEDVAKINQLAAETCGREFRIHGVWRQDGNADVALGCSRCGDWWHDFEIDATLTEIIDAASHHTCPAKEAHDGQ